jgi:hypothetical protein
MVYLTGTPPQPLGGGHRCHDGGDERGLGEPGSVHGLVATRGATSRTRAQRFCALRAPTPAT